MQAQSFTERMQAGKDNADNRRYKGFAVGCHKSWKAPSQRRPIAEDRRDYSAYLVDKVLFELNEYYQAWLADNQRKTDTWYESMIEMDSWERV